MHEHHDTIQSLRAPTRTLRDRIPGTWQGFASLHREAVASGSLPASVKELIALAIAVADGCDGCIAYHAKAAARAGATEQEAAEALGVALLMSGGPGSVYAPRAFEAFLEFKEDLPAAVG